MPTRMVVLTTAVSLLALGVACAKGTAPNSTVSPTVSPAPPSVTPIRSAPVQVTAGVIVEYWDPAQSGWIFVLDTAEHDTTAEWAARVLLVDPMAREVRGRLVLGHMPHAALSPDWSMLFLAMEGPVRGEPELTAIDSATGGLRWTTRLRPIQTTVPSHLRHMEVSADGMLVYVAAYSDETGELRPTIIDASTGQELTPNARRGSCGFAMFVRPPSGPGMLGRCENGVFEYGLGTEGSRVESPLGVDAPEDGADVPVAGRRRLTSWGVDRARDLLYLATGDGQIAAVSLDEGGTPVPEWRDLGFANRKRVPGEVVVPFAPMLVSPDGQRLYVPVRDGPCGYCGSVSGNVIEVRDTATVELIATIEPSTLVTDVVLSPDGSRLYLVDIDAGPLVVIDTTTLEEVASIEIGARTPATLLVMP